MPGERVQISGATFFNDSVEGVAYDNCKLYVETELDDTTGRAFGRGSVAYKGLTSAEFPALKAAFEAAQRRGLPFMADVEFKRVTNGKTQTTIIKSCSPLPLPVLGPQGAQGAQGAAAK
jgi:hypothetical protein